MPFGMLQQDLVYTRWSKFYDFKMTVTLHRRIRLRPKILRRVRGGPNASFQSLKFHPKRIRLSRFMSGCEPTFVNRILELSLPFLLSKKSPLLGQQVSGLPIKTPEDF